LRLEFLFYQDNRSRIAVFRKLNEPLSTVLRNGEPVRIATAAIVIDDLVIAEEGNTITDGEIVHSNDFSVNESY
jgi:Ca2+-transporting ATPase